MEKFDTAMLISLLKYEAELETQNMNISYAAKYNLAVEAMQELEKYQNTGLTPEQIEAMKPENRIIALEKQVTALEIQQQQHKNALRLFGVSGYGGSFGSSCMSFGDSSRFDAQQCCRERDKAKHAFFPDNFDSRFCETDKNPEQPDTTTQQKPERR